MKILVTGGAGYIGSFMVKKLLDDGHEVVIADSLERGHKEKLDERARFYEGNLVERKFVQNIFNENEFEAVIHFAAYISMAESMQNPGLYFTNNVMPPVNILDEMVKKGVKNIIFSSTAGVYGNPKKVPIPEDHEKNPTNPYGESKLMVENILKWYQKVNNINFVVLRYFNAAGAAVDGSMGEEHAPETHIIPNAIKAVLRGKKFMLYGEDYATPDGSCVRDYIHIYDLVEAHLLALKKITNESGGFTYNVGTGNGYSNKEIINMVKEVSGMSLEVGIEKRRPGDADTLIADVTRINSELHFKPTHSDLHTIISSAWKWHSNKRNDK